MKNSTVFARYNRIRMAGGSFGRFQNRVPIGTVSEEIGFVKCDGGNGIFFFRLTNGEKRSDCITEPGIRHWYALR